MDLEDDLIKLTTFPEDDLPQAFDILRKAMLDEPELGGYMHSWYANIRMPIYDVLTDSTKFSLSPELARRLSGEAAARILQQCFNVTIPDNFD